MSRRRIVALCAFLCLGSLRTRPAVAAQVIRTFAGGGAPERPATQMDLNGAISLAVAGDGTLVVADQGAGRIYRVDGSGAITTLAGNGALGFSADGSRAATSAIFFPTAVAFDGSGNVLFAELYGARIRKVDRTTGVLSTVAGGGPLEGAAADDGPATLAGLNSPTAIALDRAGNLYISEGLSVRRVDVKTGIITTVAGTRVTGFSGDGGPATSAQLGSPFGLAIDSKGNLFIADAGNHRIRRVDATTRTISTFAGTGDPGDDGTFDTTGGDGGSATLAKLAFPGSVRFDSNERFLYVADTYHRRVRRIELTTNVIRTYFGSGQYGGGDGSPATQAGLKNPYDIGLDAAGNLYAVDGDVVRKAAADTTIASTVAGGTYYGGDGLPATQASFFQPQGIVRDRDGNLFVADTYHHRVRRVDAQGNISTFAGSGSTSDGGFAGDGGPATAARLSSPIAVLLDSKGGVLIGDAANAAVRRVATDGIIQTIAGRGNPADGTGDGGSATQAALGGADGLALDASGNLFIGDAVRVRCVDAVTKVISTVAGGPVRGFGGDGQAATAALLGQIRGLLVSEPGCR